MIEVKNMYFDKMIDTPSIQDFKNCQYGQPILLNMNRNNIYGGYDSAIYTFITNHPQNNSILITEYKNQSNVLQFENDDLEDICVKPSDVKSGLFFILNELMKDYLHSNRKIYNEISKIRNNKKLIISLKEEFEITFESAKVSDKLLGNTQTTEHISYKYRCSSNDAKKNIEDSKRNISYEKSSQDRDLKKIIMIAKKFNLPLKEIRDQIYHTISNYSGMKFLKANRNFGGDEFIKEN